MKYKRVTPKLYATEFYDDLITAKTVINWIKNKKIKGEQTPTGRWLVLIPVEEKNKVNELLQLLESAA